MATCMFAFLGVVYREILMDINDEEGDRKGGIKTLPVIFGTPTPYCLCLFPCSDGQQCCSKYQYPSLPCFHLIASGFSSR